MDLRILVIDDDQSLCELIQESFEREKWSVSWSTSGEGGLELASDHFYDAVVTDVNLGDISGLSVCRRLTENVPDLPVVVLTGHGDMTAAVSALRAGAYDFVNKPVELGQLRKVIERSVHDRYRRQAIKRLSEAGLDDARPVGSLLGESRVMHKVYNVVRRAASTETTILLTGESGTGKELVAQALHKESQRVQQPFVAVNCAAVPGNLLESELFGHVRGSFTDAASNRRGLFEQAGQGTLFLDEVGEMPLELQPKLLRVLQERQVRPVGGNALIEVRARIIAATNRDLEGLVAAGRFREDLFYRLNVVQIHVPPLRARGNDVLLLARHFLQKFAERVGKSISGISPEASRKLLQYNWPGNVRQLENSLERAVALARSEQIKVEDLPDRIRQYDPSSEMAETFTEGITTLEQQERRHIEYVLRRVNGNRTEAARLLGINRRTLYRKLVRETSTG